MSYAVDLTRKAVDQLDSLPSDVQDRMLQKIRELGDDPRPRGSSKLANYPGDVWRVRVGDWRALYWVDDDERVVTVCRIAHRRDAYE